MQSMQWPVDVMRAQFRGGRRLLRNGSRRGLVGLTAALLLLDGACYVYQPLATAPNPGEHVSVELTDRGRVAVADRLGQGILRVEGLLVQRNSEQYVISVARVASLDGKTSNWAGERVSVPSAEVANVSGRTYSRSRTWLAVGATTAAVGAFVVTRAILGGGTSDTTGTGGINTGGGNATRIGARIALPLRFLETTFSRSRPQ